MCGLVACLDQRRQKGDVKKGAFYGIFVSEICELLRLKLIMIMLLNVINEPVEA